MTSIRKRIAERLVQAQHTAAILTTFNEVDMSKIIDLRSKYKEKFKEKYDVNLGFNGFFVKAVVEALKAYPMVNAWIDGQEVEYHNYYNIGIAISTERGLMVPNIKDADQYSVAGIETAIRDLALKGRDGKITPGDLSGGTFSITNGGVFGSLLSTPILNPPQSAILGLHKVQDRPVAINGKVEVRPMMYVALSYDHRIVDGKEAVSFLVKIKEGVEDPERLLIEV
jgi:2-oxoglutarate dehydrogenase E2 component (dihydrolipoamide succinyltransferase)